MARPKPAAEMGQYGFRLPVSVINRVDAFAVQAASALPGYKLSRSDAIRVLLERALTAEGLPAVADAPKGKRTKK
jgi:antitoxin component of RelBE/YafQ-DinJ toxin-antitoxin module